MTAPRQERREDGVAADIAKLREILARHPGESVHVTKVYASPSGGPSPWWRVCVKVGESEAFAPRYRVFDDAGSFRARALGPVS